MPTTVLAPSVGPINNSAIVTRKGFAAASETWARGAVLINSSGRLAEAATTPVAAILGLAVAAIAAAVVDTEVLYVPADADQLLEVSLAGASAASVTLAATDMFAEYGMSVTAGGIWYLDQSKTTTNACFRILAFRDIVGTAFARVYGKFSGGTIAFAQ